MAGFEAKDFFRRNALLSIFLLVGILVMGNVLVRNNVLLRADLTEDKENSVSQATRDILASMEGRLLVKAYFTRDVPPQIVPYRDRVVDLLEEYRALSRGKMVIDWIDPSDGKSKKEAEDLGIGFLPVQAIEGSQVVKKNVAMGAVFRYRDREKLISVIMPNDLPTLEYQLTPMIKTLLRPRIPTIGFLTGEPPAPPQIPGMPPQPKQGRMYDRLRQLLQDRFRLQEVDLVLGNPVPEGIDVLLVLKPDGLSEREAFEIDQFLMRGGRAMFLVDHGDYLSQQGFSRKPLASGLGDLFSHYGFEVETDLIVDLSCHAIPVPGRQVKIGDQTMQLQEERPYYYFLKVGRKGLSNEHPITRMVDAGVFFWAHPITLFPGRQPGVQMEEILHSSERSWRTDQADGVFPDERNLKRILEAAAEKGEAKSHPFGITMVGTFSSYFAGKEIPGTAEEGTEEEQPAEPERVILTESQPTRILVLGDADFANDKALNQLGVVFFLNAVDWLALDQDLIQIRSKQSRDRPIIDFKAEYEKEIGDTKVKVKNIGELFSEELGDKVESARVNESEVVEKVNRTQAMITWANILGMPALVVLAGLIRFFLRRRSKLKSLQRSGAEVNA